jgi:5-methylcytosine-specific restriction endonuclease McrA
MSAEVDEIVPFSLGGSPTDKGNVQLVHRICNQKKSNRIPRKASVPPESFGDEPSREW